MSQRRHRRRRIVVVTAIGLLVIGSAAVAVPAYADPHNYCEQPSGAQPGTDPQGALADGADAFYAPLLTKFASLFRLPEAPTCGVGSQVIDKAAEGLVLRGVRSGIAGSSAKSGVERMQLQQAVNEGVKRGLDGSGDGSSSEPATPSPPPPAAPAAPQPEPPSEKPLAPPAQSAPTSPPVPVAPPPAPANTEPAPSAPDPAPASNEVTILDQYFNGTAGYPLPTPDGWVDATQAAAAGLRWYPNGELSVQCTSSGPSYRAFDSNGQPYVTSWWVRASDGLWIRAATVVGVESPAQPNLPTC